MSTFSGRTIVKQISGTGGLEAVGQIVSFLGVIAYTQLVPQTVLGEYFLLVAIVSVTSFIGATGVSTNITRRINQSSKPGEDLMTATVFLTFITVCLTVSSLLGQSVLNSFVGHIFGVSLLILLPVSTFTLFTGSVLRGEKKNIRAMTLQTTQKIFTYSIGNFAIIFGFDPGLALVTGLLCGKLSELGGGILLIDNSPSGIPRLEELGDLARRTVDLTAAGLGSLGQEWVDTLIIGAILTPQVVAIYEVAWRLSAVGLVVTNAVASVSYPRFAEAVDHENYQALREYVNSGLFYVSLPMVALFAGALAIGPKLITVIYGTSYSAAYLPLLILLAGRLPYSLSRILTQVGYSYNVDNGIARASISAALLNAIVNIFLISWIGIVGAAISSVLSYIALSLSLFHLLSGRVGYPEIKQFVPGFVASGVMFVAIRILSIGVRSSLLSLLSLIFVGCVVFVSVLIVLSPTIRSDFTTFVDLDLIK